MTSMRLTGAADVPASILIVPFPPIAYSLALSKQIDPTVTSTCPSINTVRSVCIMLPKIVLTPGALGGDTSIQLLPNQFPEISLFHSGSGIGPYITRVDQLEPIDGACDDARKLKGDICSTGVHRE